MTTMSRADSYRDLIAWQKAMALVRSVYQTTAGFPMDERFGLTAQIRRSAVSIPSNIAEGSGRSGTREFKHGLSLAHGSLCELETQLMIAADLGLCKPEQLSDVLDQTAEIGRIIRGLIRKLDNTSS
jgi:four helix bundle protein